MIRDDIKTALVVAMKARDTTTTAAIRLIQSSIKNRDIELRTASSQPEDDLLITEVLQKMIKQRRESIDMYEKGNRPELAAAEAAEVAVIERFLPQQMSEEEAKAAIDTIATELGAASVKDMGRVMAALKDRHAGQMDMAKASGLVKARLA
ncbi:GatB/YqeY domain-containing protein [Rhizorhabdus argentea]|uniref:GatB/YqeY domain-containing protein n=1 Tax=Rhizorhabdus argentea TaxID=1387174 RepID=UPI0030ED2496